MELSTLQLANLFPFQSAGFTGFQWIAIFAIFIWSGFVRSGIGFGGAALGLPLLLLVADQPLFFLPIIASHLLFFTTITSGGRLKNIEWSFIKRSMGWMIIPKLAGVIGLLSLPNTWLVIFVFTISALYGITWFIQREIRYQSPWVDRLLLIIGGYVSGASLVGAPLIAAVAIKEIELTRYRDTLFVLWFILVCIKMSAFVVAGVDLQLHWALILLLPAAIGHLIGLRFHDLMVHQDSVKTKRILGAGLFIVSLAGLLQTLL